MPDDGLLILPAAMARIDRAAIASGIPGPVLMENAGRAVARAIVARFARQPTLVLCGPGNNGGDGYVVARLLAGIGWPVEVASSVERTALAGDAAWAAGTWDGPVAALDPALLGRSALIVDALFGAGLTRPLEGVVRDVVEALPATSEVVAIDVPSGCDGATGEVRGAAPHATLTVTFCRAKPGHYLLPARGHMGEITLADIGIPDACVADQDAGIRLNQPSLWRTSLPHRVPEGHKYRYGHALVMGGPSAATGAARLAAMAALRTGAGLVSIASDPAAVAMYAGHLTTVMVKPLDDEGAWARLLDDRRYNAVLIGPGAGVGPATEARVATLLETRRAAVLDADAITCIGRSPLREGLHAGCVLTPHDGEFARISERLGSRLERAAAAAADLGCTIVLKGADTVVASPDGRACILGIDAPMLATAGTGDVLAGIVLGLLAQGMPTHEAAAAAVWLHAQAARNVGPGLIAEDLPASVPGALAMAA